MLTFLSRLPTIRYAFFNVISVMWSLVQKKIIAFCKQVEGKLNKLHSRTVWGPQAVGTTFLRNVGKCLAIDMP